MIKNFIFEKDACCDFCCEMLRPYYPILKTGKGANTEYACLACLEDPDSHFHIIKRKAPSLSTKDKNKLVEKFTILYSRHLIEESKFVCSLDYNFLAKGKK